MPREAYKECTLCREAKPKEAFNKRSCELDRLDKRCRDCVNERSRESKRRYAERNAEKVALAKRLYAEKYPERIVAVQRRCKERYPEKRRARVTLGNALQRGQIHKPENCEQCGRRCKRRELHGHHRDYSKPLNVEWLCAQCHAKEHQIDGRTIRIPIPSV